MSEKQLSEFQKALTVRNRIIRIGAECQEYHASLGKDFVFKQITEWAKRLKADYPELATINIHQLSHRQCLELNFGLWSDDLPIYLIPLYLYPFLPETIDAVSISGERIASVQAMDTDTRFGCIAYGIYPANPLAAQISRFFWRLDEALFELFGNKQ